MKSPNSKGEMIYFDWPTVHPTAPMYGTVEAVDTTTYKVRWDDGSTGQIKKDKVIEYEGERS